MRQEEALQQMAKKLEEKKLEAVEAEERCHSLQVELDKSQSQLISSQQQISGNRICLCWRDMLRFTFVQLRTIESVV